MKHYLGICLVLITLAGIAFFAVRSCTNAVDHSVDHVRDAFVQVFRVQPQITMSQRVVLTQTAPIAELAVVTKEELVTLGFDEHIEVFTFPVPLTEKKLTAEATYRLKAGFDLREPFTVEIDPQSHHLSATLPRAKILSVEQIGELTYHGDDAVLNRITDEEREKIVNDLMSAARNSAEQSSLKADAEQQATQRLQEILQHNGQPMEISWLTPAPQTPPKQP